MFHDFYQNIPSYIDPIAFSIGSFAVRWYGLMYLVGLLVVYGLLKIRISKGEFTNLNLKSEISISNKIPNSKSQTPNEINDEKKDKLSVISYQLSVAQDYLLIAFFSAFIGGRIGYVLLYNFSHYISHPLAIISPYDQSGNFIGLYGMSYHGAFVGVIVGTYLFLRKRRIDFLCWTDFVVPAIPLGYFFGRFGNFLNGELYGRVTDSVLGMYFSADKGQLRFPVQLFEAIGEGIIMFMLLWAIRNKTERRGLLSSFYVMGYAAIRFMVEFLREPDSQLGLFFNFISMGQILSSVMLIFGIFLYAFSKKETVL